MADIECKHKPPSGGSGTPPRQKPKDAETISITSVYEIDVKRKTCTVYFIDHWIKRS